MNTIPFRTRLWAVGFLILTAFFFFMFSSESIPPALLGFLLVIPPLVLFIPISEKQLLKLQAVVLLLTPMLIMGFCIVFFIQLTSSDNSGDNIWLTLFLLLMPILVLLWFCFRIFWFQWAAVLAQLGMPNLAIAHYTNLLRLAPNSPILFSNRALLHLNQANYDDALADYDRAIELVRAQKKQDNAASTVDFRSNLSGLYGSRAAVHIANHDFEPAIADCDTGLAIPDLSPMVQAFLHHNRAAALSELQEYSDALIDIEMGEEHAQSLPDHQAILLPMLRSQKALALYQLERETDAAAVWQTLVRTHPNYQNVEWLKNDMKWRDWQLDVAKQLINNPSQVNVA